jgi:homoprotocatechuate degradation regulator HpaR
MHHRIAHRNLPHRLLVARERLMANFRPILNHFGLTEQQWRILRTLDDQEQLEPRELCERCQIQSSNMPGVLERLAAMGLVDRRRDAADQRRVLVRLAPHGERLVGELAPYIEQQYRHIEKAFGKPTLIELDRAIEAFLAIDADAVLRVELPAIAKARS